MRGLRPASVILKVIVLPKFSVPPVKRVSVSVALSPMLRFKVTVPVPVLPKLRLVRFEIRLPAPSRRLRVDPPPTSRLVIRLGLVKPPVKARVLASMARTEARVTGSHECAVGSDDNSQIHLLHT